MYKLAKLAKITILIISLIIIFIYYQKNITHKSDYFKGIPKTQMPPPYPNHNPNQTPNPNPNTTPTTNQNNSTPLTKSFQKEYLPAFQQLYSAEKENKLLENAIANNPVSEVLLENTHAKKISHTFSHRINPTTDVTDQKNTGRCWIFSFLNIFRYQMIRELDLPPDFQLSQSYLSFFDKLEKCHYFLQNIATTKEDDLDSRKINWMLSNTLSDGGNWNMLVNLINKYGVVPENVMPETYQSSHSESLNMFLIENLKRMASQIRSNNIGNISLNDYIYQQTYFIYKLLVIFLGNPPNLFDWEYQTSTNNKITKLDNLTPLSFANSYLNFNSNDWLVCGNFPIPEYPFYHKYNIRYCNNMIDGQNTEVFNLPISELAYLAKQALDDNQPVWIAADWGKYYSCHHSSLDIDLYDYQRLGYYPIDKGLSLEYKISRPNHAILIIGYNLDSNSKIDRWLVENSHGSSICRKQKDHEPEMKGKGYVTMTSEWFNNYVYQIVVEKRYLSSQLRQALNKQPVEVEPWGAMGCELLSVTH